MQGFKCDICGKWVEGNPPSEYDHQWLFADHKPFYSVSIRADIRIGEGVKADLCCVCYLTALRAYMVKAAKEE